MHDHFDGSAHCVECGGACRLTGVDRHYTELVRAVLQFAVYNSLTGVSLYLARTLEDAGVNVEKMLRRAKAHTEAGG